MVIRLRIDERTYILASLAGTELHDWQESLIEVLTGE